MASLLAKQNGLVAKQASKARSVPALPLGSGRVAVSRSSVAAPRRADVQEQVRAPCRAKCFLQSWEMMRDREVILRLNPCRASPELQASRQVFVAAQAGTKSPAARTTEEEYIEVRLALRPPYPVQRLDNHRDAPPSGTDGRALLRACTPAAYQKRAWANPASSHAKK